MGSVLTLLQPGRASVFDLRRKQRSACLSCAAVGFALLVISHLGLGASPAADEARRLVALLDYLGSDYKNAVRDGKIVSEDEFHEMPEFAKQSLDLLVQIKKVAQGDKAGIEQDLRTLAKHVEKNADARAVAALLGALAADHAAEHSGSDSSSRNLPHRRNSHRSRTHALRIPRNRCLDGARAEQGAIKASGDDYLVERFKTPDLAVVRRLHCHE